MRFRSFLELLILVAIVAAIYAPPIQTVLEHRLRLWSTLSPLNEGWSGTSIFTSIAREDGYRVVLANSTLSDLRMMGGRVLYVLLGPDYPLTSEEAAFIGSMMKKGGLSILVAQGNRSNNHFFSKLFGFNITGNPIVDPDSPYQDRRILIAHVTLTESYDVRLNVASPIVIVGGDAGLGGFTVRPIGFTDRDVYDMGNEAPGVRVVAVAIYMDEKPRGLVVSDSGIFINSVLNATETSSGRVFTSAVIDWLTQGDKDTVIVIDDAHYDKFGGRGRIPLILPPLGMIAAIFLTSYLKTFNQTYDALLNSTPFPMLMAMGGLALISTYYGLRRWMGRQPIGVDTAAAPVIESERLIEATPVKEMTGLKKGGRFYMNTLTRLYYVLDTLIDREFGAHIDEIDEDAEMHIKAKIGEEGFDRLKRVLRELRRIRDRYEGRRMLLFPPILNWGGKFSALTEDTDQVLKAMGTYLVEAERGVKGIEYRLRRR